jgi:DNA-binding NarL/FixJ family response regulator
MSAVKILIVEDEAIVAMEIEHRLSMLGYDICDVSSSGEKAIILAETHKPDLVLMDIKLKGNMNGLIAARIIKEKLNIPSVFITANSDQNTINQIDELLHFECLFKPIEEEDLLKAIENTIKRYKSEN